MKAKYGNTTVTVAPGYLSALYDLMRAQMAMMQANDAQYADCWIWGCCTIKDLAYSDGIVFEYGGAEDKPDGMAGDMQVVIEGWVRNGKVFIEEWRTGDEQPV